MGDMLCIGGPYAGRRMSGVGLQLVIPAKPSSAYPISFDPYGKVPIDAVIYNQRTIYTDDGPISFWVLQNQTVLDAIKTLASTYETLLNST